MTACDTLEAIDPPLPREKIVTVYPVMPPTKCARRPKPPVAEADDPALAAYLKQKDAADDDCRDKLDAIDATVSSWPKPKTDQ